MADRENVIQGLKCCEVTACGRECPYSTVGGCAKHLMEDARSLLEQQTGWNSMADKRPTECKCYLCITKWHGYQVCLWYGGEWCWMDHTYVTDEIKWWRELPEPPEEVSRDG